MRFRTKQEEKFEYVGSLWEKIQELDRMIFGKQYEVCSSGYSRKQVCASMDYLLLLKYMSY